MGKVYDLTGQRFGRLVVVGRDGHIYGQCKAWKCVCDCGGAATSSTTKLIKGDKQSCGCLELENNGSLYVHGHYGTKTYKIWQGMKQRCLNVNSRFYPIYGGRGIEICEKWMTFEGFFEDMGECPPNMTIDRVDNDSNYCRENCRWATMKQQSNNRSTTILLVIGDCEKSLKEWSEHFCIKYTTAYYRYKQGWTAERIFGLK